MYDPVIFQDYVEDEKPEMSRAMESFLIQQEKERKEKELKQQKEKEEEEKKMNSQKSKEIKPLPTGYVPEMSPSDQKGKKENEEENKKKVKNQN